jgi:alginate O-acetyltransferase complex protein AlgI
MLFNSQAFVIFSLVVFVLYYLPCFRNWQAALLVLASFVFYSWTWWKATLLLLFSVLFNATVSYKVITGGRARAKAYATAGIVLNLLILAAFKYKGLLVPAVMSGSLRSDSFLTFWLGLILPLGISFFTFEGISLLVDAYNGAFQPVAEPRQISAGRHLLQTSLFVSFFPHLIAGPILRAKDFFPQITPKRFKDIQWESAFRHLVSGYFLKMVLADNLKEITSFLAYPFQGIHPLDLLVMLFAYSFQILADFSGYSLIAIGLAELLGYRLINNFNFPYISQSFAEFWKRWHISLSTWLRDYLYFPLGGNRRGSLRTYLNLLVVMTLGGLWHGAAWSYALWGLVHGFALTTERWFRKYWGWGGHPVFGAVRVGLVFTVVTFAWLFFRLPVFSDVVAFYQTLLTRPTNPFHFAFRHFAAIIYSLPIVVFHVLYLRGHDYTELDAPWFYALLLFLIALNSGFSGSFIYFRF